MFFCFCVERHIDGESFIELTREDFSIIFPSNEKFMIGSRLYKIARDARSNSDVRNTASLLDDLDQFDSSASQGCTSSAISRASTPGSHDSGRKSSDHSSYSMAQKQACDSRAPKRRSADPISSSESESCKFKLPVFSPDVKKCILKDAFYTSTQRNRLIKEACTALRGHCWEKEQPITSFEKKDLAKSLYELAPKSLGDPGNRSKPEVSIHVHYSQCHLVLMITCLSSI